RAEIIVVGMDFETFERIDRRLRPLPDIADDIVEFTLRKFVDRITGCQMVEMNIGCGGLPERNLGQSRHVVQPVPLVLCRQSVRLTGGRRFPVAESLGRMVIDLHRPIPGHGHYPRDRAKAPLRALSDPECGMPGLDMTPSLPALF